jgi:hypothetical protein
LLIDGTTTSAAARASAAQFFWSDDGDAERVLAEHVRVIRSIADGDHALGAHLPDAVRLLRGLGSSSPHAAARSTRRSLAVRFHPPTRGGFSG